MIPKGNDDMNDKGISKNQPCFSKRSFRICLLAPISLVSQILFCMAAIGDFAGYPSSSGLIVLTTLSPLENVPVRGAAFALFLAVLVLDWGFAVEAVLRGGLSKLKALLPLMLHHLGFGAWAFQIVIGFLPYCSGTSYVLFLLEFCFPLRLLLGWFYPSTAASSRVKLVWQARLFALDMFFSGGGAFSALFSYSIIIMDPDLSESERKSLLITYGMAIVYWFQQLFLVHLPSLNRLLGNLARDPVAKDPAAKSPDESDRTETLDDSTMARNLAAKNPDEPDRTGTLDDSTVHPIPEP